MIMLAGMMVASLPAKSACNLDTDPVSFGRIEPSRTSLANGRIIVDCDTASSFDVGITGEAQGNLRVMRRAEGDPLVYQLYTNASLTIPWGDNSSIGPTVGGSVEAGGRKALTIYGAIPAQQGILPGNYIGQLSVVLSF